MAKQVNLDTGEVTDELEGLVEAKEDLDALETQLLSNFKQKDLLAKLDQVEKAKEDKWRDTEKDFWKPVREGDELRGIYLGTGQGNKYKVHMVGRKDPVTGKPIAMRINGTTVLTREFKKIDPGTPVRIVFTGFGKTDSGMKLSEFIVQVMDA